MRVLFFLFVLFAGYSYAAQVPVKMGPGSKFDVEYKRNNNTYTWAPVTGTTPRTPGAFSWPATGSVSDVESKFTARGRLPYEHKGGYTAQNDVSMTFPVDPSKAAKAAGGRFAEAVSACVRPGNLAVSLVSLAGCAGAAALFDAAIAWGINKVGRASDGSAVAFVVDPQYDPSDGRTYTISGFKALSFQAACYNFAYSYLPSISAGIVVNNVSMNFNASNYTGQCLVTATPKNGSQTNYSRTASGVAGSSCPVGSYVGRTTNSCADEDYLAERPAASAFETAYKDYPYSPKHAGVVAGVIDAGDNVFTDGTGTSITGPNSVPYSSKTSRGTLSVVPGTTTPAPSGYSGPTDPATSTTTTTSTANNTFSPTSPSSGNSSGSRPTPSMTTNITNVTITTITNINTGGSSTTTTTDESDDPPEDPVTDTPDPELPELYKQKYPQGLSGVISSKISEIKLTPIFQLPSQLMGSLPSTGSCPSWSLDLNLASFAPLGVWSIGADCSIWAFARICIIIGALILARALIAGG